ncbi:hypothetical protein phiAS5_ORF0299 [Aeromonas phage phiAS5]|uniref:Uncharacterized protein n=1 Tax=Aeromonas phage phiAS5 TaxID=879630 RepID=E1A253_9CAUD|nr:hypothetical protein phiAS5_ORF0299 [Aeromonas phage phiAS5]ADM80142.1 hypothetical protein phiAS5_ORF0299 [Aeromonas phage phiAS5]BES53096.1 hypothetical protein [Aeromonas phage phiWae14]
MSRTVRVKNKTERKYLIGNDFWKDNNNVFYRIGKYDYWRKHLREERLKMDVRQEFEREDSQISRGYNCEVTKEGNYSNRSALEYANLGRAKVRDQLKAICLESAEDADIMCDRKYRTCAYRWFVLW